LAALAEALATVRQGSPAALLIGGEAGVGKSRLIAEFAASARESGARVLTGECLELGADGLPFGPFTAMLRDLVRELGASKVTGLLPGGNRATRELARLLPELSGTEGAPATPGESRARLFEEFLSLLEVPRAGPKRPPGPTPSAYSPSRTAWGTPVASVAGMGSGTRCRCR
jgi:predicted ATPase